MWPFAMVKNDLSCFSLSQEPDGNGGLILRLPSVSPHLNDARFRCGIKDKSISVSLRDEVCSMPAQGTTIYTSAFVFVEGG